MSYDPKSIYVPAEQGNPFELVQNGLEWLLKESQARGYVAQVTGSCNASSTTRFAVSQITQHTDLNTISFTLLLAKGKQVASASSSLLGQTALVSLLDTVIVGVKSTPEIEFYQGLPSVTSAYPINLSGREWSIEDRADAVIRTVNAAEEVDEKVIIAGVAEEVRSYKHIMSTEGIDVETSSLQNYFKVNTILGPPDARGYGQEEIYWRHELPPMENLAKEATQTAKDTLKLKTFDAKEYEVVLGSQAVADLMVYVLFSATPVDFHESNSFASDRLGEQIFDTKVTIEDLPRDSYQANRVRSFDTEGVATQNRILFDQGALKFIPYDSFFAAKYLDEKDQATGHQVTMFDRGMSMPISAVIKAGDRSLEQQLSEVKDGLYVKNFWYNRFTKRREGGLTGLTRNGLYQVKDGEVRGAVRNLRYTESFVRAFEPGNVISLSTDRRQYDLANCPSMHLQRFNFSSVAHSSD
jgi:predicted Zn-dependent protease